ncbi:MAG: ABC transporter ATP-binding protein [Alphaproteobacteria bacterium]
MYLDRRLWAFTAGLRDRVAVAVALGLLSAVAGVARLALLGWLVARVIDGAAVADLVPAIVGIAVAMAARGLLDYWRAMVAHETAARVQSRLRDQLHRHILELGPAHFETARTGDVSLALVDGVEQLETFFGRYLPQLFVALLTPIAIFAFIAWLDLPVGLVMLSFAIVTLLAPSLFHRWDRAASKARARAFAAFAAELLDSLQGLATLKAFGQSGRRGAVLAEKAHELFRRTMWVLGTNTLARGITDTGIALGTAATIALGAFRVVDGEMSLAALLVILMMGVEAYRPQRELRSLLHQGMLGQAAAENILRLLGARPIVPDAGAAPAAPLAPSIAFDHVTFAYPGGRRAAHQDLSFAIRPGERVAFVGPSGAGKSSIVKLLLRFHDPAAGTVRLGGIDLRTLAPAAIRAHFAVVHQDTYLFHGTVAENLRLGKTDATDAELEAAARAANALDFIRALPQGLETVVGERGLRLSGGQRQRIAIARALLSDAPILVLDEALSAVDSENEALIQEALDRLMQGRTTLIIAHRLSSVIGADRILVLDQGRVAEEGTHGQLMQRGGAYHRLMAAQAAEASGAAEPLAAAAAEPEPSPPAPTGAAREAAAMGAWRTLAVLFGFIGPWKGTLALTFALGIGRVAAFIGISVLAALTVAAVKHGEPFGGLLVALFVAAPLAGILHWLESWIAHDMAYRLLTEMRIDLYRKLDALAPAYLLRRRSGELVAMATQDVELVEYFFAHTVAPAFVAVVVPAIVLGTLAAYGWPLALVLLPFLLAAGLTPVLGRARIDRLGVETRNALADMNAVAVDTIQGLAEISAFRQEASRAAAFRARVADYLRIRLPLVRDLTAQHALLEVATGLGGLAVIVTGALAGGIDTAMLPMLALLAMSAFLPVSEIAHVGRQLAETFASTRRIHAVHAEPVRVSDGPGVDVRANARGRAIAFERVSFGYPETRRPAVAEVSFEVPAGATVALVGPSGAGKSTLAQLVLRFWDPDQGMVRLDGRDLREWKLDQLRAEIALVAQDTYLFHDTLRANIALARPEASEAEIMAAVERASLAPFVASLPKGLDTEVGERGVQLSGGQRQRVAIARAFLKDAPVLVLDEATSHLDAVSEREVRAALDALMGNRTTIVIAHRLSTVRDADRIVVLDGGRVAETGSHGELLARQGLYAQLVRRQMAGAIGTAAQ